MNERVHLRSYTATLPAFIAGSDTPRAFLERCLAAVDAHETSVHAFVATHFERARAEADASTARWHGGRPLSPVDGMPIGVKDIIETADMPTGMGSPLFAGRHSGRDAASVRALREAGALIVGKTVTTEFAATRPGPTCNPWDLARTPGGSSSGSAAGVACGFMSAGLGTQVVGSIVRPASFCGVWGVKPTFGAIHRGGSHDFMSQSSQGVLAASLDDAWQVMTAIAERIGGDPGARGFEGAPQVPEPRLPRQLAWLETAGWPHTSSLLRDSANGAVDQLRSAGVEVLDRRRSATVERVEAALVEAMEVTRAIITWESRWPLNIYREQDASGLSEEMLLRLAAAEAMSLADYHEAMARRNRIRETYRELVNEVEGCLTLSATGPAPIGLQSTGNPAFAVPASLLGCPALTWAALMEQGLPVGMQLIGFAHRDAELFAIAGAVSARLRLPRC